MGDKSRQQQEKVRMFELFLLSVMRVEGSALESALHALDASADDLSNVKKSMMSMGFNSTIVKIDLYHEILGDPITIETIDDRSLPSAFSVSSLLCFHLPLWPTLDFTIHERPDGIAWGPAFRRPPGVQRPPLDSLDDLEPWKFIKKEVTDRFGDPVFGDAWDYWEELYYMIPFRQDEPPRKCLLIFDYNLLQSFEVSD